MQYKQLDGLRFFAVMAVLFDHLFENTLLAKWTHFGEFGVNLFFVISGFLITEILITEKIKETPSSRVLKIFFARRILRIFPLYYLYILICLFAVPIETYKYLPWLLTYSINIWEAIANKPAFWYFTHLWSLCTEEQFYIFWPFLILFSPLKRLKFIFSSMIVLSIIYRFINTIYLTNHGWFNYTMLPTTFDCFGAGALLAYLKIFSPTLLNNILRHKYLIIAGFMLYILNSVLGTMVIKETLSRAFIAFVAFYLVGISATIKFKYVSKKILENKLINYLGKISYGIYIYHFFVLGSLRKYFNSLYFHLDITSKRNTSITKMLFEFVIISICTFLLAKISYELFEMRFLRIKKYFKYANQKQKH